jgi:hypothetical protein
MATSRTFQRLFTAITLLLGGAFCLSWFGLFPWSGINCTTIEIDLSSGRIRSTRYLLWLAAKSVISDTILTEALSPADLQGVQCEWQPVVTQSPGVNHSPHYRYHACLSQIRDLELFWRNGDVAKEMRRNDSLKILRLWRLRGCRDVWLYLDSTYGTAAGESDHDNRGHSDHDNRCFVLRRIIGRSTGGLSSCIGLVNVVP